MKKILFVCHGNICRSPMAEFVMKDLVQKAGLTDQFHIASAATSREEIGNPVYPPARRKLAEHSINENPRGLLSCKRPRGAVLFCRLGFFFLAYASRSLRFRTKAAARIVTGRAMTQTSTPVSPVAGVLLPPV